MERDWDGIASFKVLIGCEQVFPVFPVFCFHSNRNRLELRPSRSGSGYGSIYAKIIDVERERDHYQAASERRAPRIGMAFTFAPVHWRWWWWKSCAKYMQAIHRTWRDLENKRRKKLDTCFSRFQFLSLLFVQSTCIQWTRKSLNQGLKLDKQVQLTLI